MEYKAGDKITVEGEECVVTALYGDEEAIVVRTPGGVTKKVLLEQPEDTGEEGEEEEAEEEEEEVEEEEEEVEEEEAEEEEAEVEEEEKAEDEETESNNEG